MRCELIDKVPRRYRSKYLKILIWLFVVGIVSLRVCLISSADFLDDYTSAREIKVIIGETKPLGVNNPRQVKIGNPSLLDVVGAGQRELLLDGRQEGETTLSVVDSLGQHVYNVKIFVEDLDKVKERVDFLLEAAGFEQLTTKVGDKERKIFIMGTVLNSQKDSFEDKISSIEDKIVNLIEYEDDIVSVEIDVEVLEIVKDDVDKLGLTWNKSVGFSEIGKESSATTTFDASNDSWPQVFNPDKYFQVLKTWRTTGFTATLNLLKQRNKARTLSRPKIVCLSGKNAKLLVGGERAIIAQANVSDAGTTSYDVEYKEYGIALTITPTVKDNDEIQVALQTEIREVDTTESLSLGANISTPGFKERSADTELTVMNGQTVFLAGLIEAKSTDNRDGIWGLADIPFIGALFRGREHKIEDTDILIILTPTIIKNKNREPAPSVAAITLPGERRPLSLDGEANPEYGRYEQSDTMRRDADPVVQYSSLVQNIINSKVLYPQELKDQFTEGTVQLSLRLQSSGKLLGVVIMRSSGNVVLDEIAERSVKKLSPFPAFPPGVKLRELWIDIPIVYKIRNSV